ncbi:MAG: hypothetical protein NC217_05905 [Muribaculaceae bacterium]|nr:hypothetical protein [Muribaculaceae bacterium]
MKQSRLLLAGALGLLAIGIMSCKGRRVDATPVGDTVEVVIESNPTAITPDAPADTTTLPQ